MIRYEISRMINGQGEIVKVASTPKEAKVEFARLIHSMIDEMKKEYKTGNYSKYSDKELDDFVYELWMDEVEDDEENDIFNFNLIESYPITMLEIRLFLSKENENA